MISIYMSNLILIYCAVLAVIIGAVAGSFLNCMAWRIVHGESISRGRSHCPTCGHVLGIVDLIPIFSWIFLKGKCRYCGTKIGVRYFLAELVMAVISLVTLLRLDLTPEFTRDMLFVCCLFTLSAVDLESMIIPDRFLILSAVIWIVFLPFMGYSTQDIILHLAAAVIYFAAFLGISLVMDKILGKDSLGGGDIKLFAVMGLYLGVVSSVFAVIIACFIGLAFAFIYKGANGQSDAEEIEEDDIPDKAFPFGPAIALAIWLMLLFGEELSSWYIGMII